MQRLEIAADGDRFSEHRTVITHHPLQWTDRGTGRRPLLQAAEVDLLGGNGDAFFREEYPHALQVRRPAAPSYSFIAGLGSFPNSLTPCSTPAVRGGGKQRRNNAFFVILMQMPPIS
jgi:hypothetical protein